MSRPFGVRRRARTEQLLNDIRARLDEMETRFRRVEENMERSAARGPQSQQPQQPQIQIENVHIHQPVLEKLEFRLDALDIEQLSGSLNLGNNFGAKWAGVRESDSGSAAGKSASRASNTGGSNAGASSAGAVAGKRADGRSASSTGATAGRSASGSNNIGGSLGPETGDGLRETPSGYRWNNRR